MKPSTREKRIAASFATAIEKARANSEDELDLASSVSLVLAQYRLELVGLFEAAAKRLEMEAKENLRDANGLRHAAAEVESLCQVINYGKVASVVDSEDAFE